MKKRAKPVKPKDTEKGKPKPTVRNTPLRIPLDFDSAVAGLVNTKRQSKKED